MKKLFLLLWCFLSMVGISNAASTDGEGYPLLYLRGSMTNNYAAQENYRFTRNGNTYTLTLASLDGQFKIADDSWSSVNHTYGSTISGDGDYQFNKNTGNANTSVSGLRNVTLSFSINKDNLAAPFTLTVTQQGGGGNEGEHGQYYVYFNNTDNWPIPYVWAWNDQENCTAAGIKNWPGDAMTKQDDGKWYWEVPAGKSVPTQIIFSNHGNPQTDDVAFVNGATYKPDGSHSGGQVVVSHLEPTGTLPVLYVNVYTDETKTQLDNNIIDKDLAHKNYFTSAEYWIDMKDCQWLKDLGATDIGSAEEPLPLEIKARGNFTRKGYSKKPFKLKLGSKKNLLNINAKGEKSKHWAILAHADDSYGYMRNFVGFRLGEMIGLPWTPRQQPIEVVINGDYRGIYFLTESIRVGDGRVPITELDDNVSDPALISGGYLVELDNYIDDCAFHLPDASNKNTDPQYGSLMVTPDTPEDLSGIQLQFLKEQFTKMNNLVNSSDDSELWSYLELDDAARYYVVEEILSHFEAYHGSTYLFRDFGNGKKWHFSPLWDCGHAFDGPTNQFFPDMTTYNGNTSYGNNWIGNSSNKGLRGKSKFMDKVSKTFQWFVNKDVDGSSSPYDRLKVEIDDYVSHIKDAAVRDAERWRGVERPNQIGADVPRDVIDNSDILDDKSKVKTHLENKINWLKSKWGSAALDEPARDETPAAPLPDYANPDLEHHTYTIHVKDDNASGTVKAWIYDDLSAADKDVFGDSWNGSQVFTSKVAGDGSTYYTLQIDLTRELVNPKVKIICGSNASASVEFVDGRFYNLSGETVTNFDPEYVPPRSHIYFDNTENWSKPCVWAWNSQVSTVNSNTSFPGDPMVKGEDGKYVWTLPAGKPEPTMLIISDNGGRSTGNKEFVNGATYYPDGSHVGGDFVVSTVQPTGTLPVLYINVYTDETKTELDYNIINKDLAHKNYFSNSEYWIDMKDCDWLDAEAIGSAEEPLPLEIKARGNFTRKGYSKKPFKLKLGKKQNLLNINANGEKSKHWAILAHADDSYGYMRNFVGFRLGEMIGLPWTPRQQPIEVVINGDYRGIYFLTESIRVGDGRVPITELDDNVSDPALVSGGYLVELDNYIDDCTFALPDASNKNQYPIDGHSGNRYSDLMVTADTPEEYSDLQLRFVKEQFTKMNDLVNSNDDEELWSYLQLDDAARYYVVEEIISHYEAYHGSTYLFRDHGNGQKWHFSPMWDCGHAFDGATNNFFADDSQYGNNWIGNFGNQKGLRSKAKFMEKVKASFQWFVNKDVDGSSSPYDRLKIEIKDYVDHIKAAANRDVERWKDEPLPNKVGNDEPQPVVDNSDIDSDKTAVLNHLDAKITWLKGKWGSAALDEPERDDTPAAPLPDYADPDIQHYTYTIYVKDDSANGEIKAWITDAQSEANHDVFGESRNGSQVFTPHTAGDGSTYYSLEVVLTRELDNPMVEIICGGHTSASVEFVDGRFYNLNGETVVFDPNHVPEPPHIYVINDANWGTVSMWLYIKNGSNYSGAWPGEKLEINNDLKVNGVTGVYEFAVDAAYSRGEVIFSNAGENQHPGQNQPGLELKGKTMVFYTSSHRWEEPESVEYVTPWSKTLPLVRITTPNNNEIGYGDVGAVKKSVFELDALGLEGVTAIDGSQAGNVTIKGRGKSYWDTFEKKSYKLKFKNKIAVLGMPVSAHWVLMPYANDAAYGLLANYTGHELSRLIGLEWTPAMQPVELVIDGDYKGLYFIAENVRAAADRVQIADYGDATYSEEDDFLLEFSSAHEDNGTELFHSWTSDNGFENKLITATPSKEKVYEDAITPAEGDEIFVRIKEYLTSHMDNLSNAVAEAKANPGSAAWTNVIDYEQAAKYYIVQELMDDKGSFDDNFYIHHTTGSKWILGPVWDFANAFASNGNKESLIHDRDDFSGSFIKDLYKNRFFIWFTAKTFVLFNEGQSARHNTRAKANIQNDYSPVIPGTLDEVNSSIDDMVDKIQDAAESDAVRWPQYAATSEDNSLASRAQTVKANLSQAKDYLTMPTAVGGAGWTEDGVITGIENVVADGDIDAKAEYFDVMGRRVTNPQAGSVYIVRRGTTVTKKLIK